jgi:hypothetical protein
MLRANTHTKSVPILALSVKTATDVCAGTLSLVRGETVVHEFEMGLPADDLPADSEAPAARFCPPPSARRSGLAGLVEDSLSPPIWSGCPVTRAAPCGPAVPVSLRGCTCQPVTRGDHLRLLAESPAAICCLSSSASPYRTVGCRVPPSALLSSAPPSVSFGAVWRGCAGGHPPSGRRGSAPAGGRPKRACSLRLFLESSCLLRNALGLSLAPCCVGLIPRSGYAVPRPGLASERKDT